MTITASRRDDREMNKVMNKYGQWPSTTDLVGATCEKMDPDLWTKDHAHNEVHEVCNHAVAAHICRRHCPILAQCHEVARRRAATWAGMVMGGVLWTLEGKPTVRQPATDPNPSWCPTCRLPDAA